MRKSIVLFLMTALLIAGCEKEPEEQEKPLYPTEGAINARFSVGDTTTVVFAKGNLQYKANGRVWRFANNQYEVIGYNNELIDTTYNGWIDLFGWGTSGYRGLMPYSIDDTNTHYGLVNADIARTDYDWGRFNPISNGGDKAGVWRTLDVDEWSYLLRWRKSAHAKKGLATIKNPGESIDVAVGLILLPDKWELPEGCTFTPGMDSGYATNVYFMDDWNRMEGAGAVFLPAGGYRDVRAVNMVGEYGCYWTSSFNDELSAYELYMQTSGFALGTAARSNGHNVRLVQNR